MMSRWRVSKFEKYQEDKFDGGGKKPWADMAANDERLENNDNEQKVAGFEKEKI